MQWPLQVSSTNIKYVGGAWITQKKERKYFQKNRSRFCFQPKCFPAAADVIQYYYYIFSTLNLFLGGSQTTRQGLKSCRSAGLGITIGHPQQ